MFAPPGLSLQALIAHTGPVTERLRVREIDDDEGRRLVRIIRRGSGSVVTWRRAQMVLLSAQGMDAAAIAKVAFTSDRVARRDPATSSSDGFDSLYPKYKGGHPPKFTLAPAAGDSRRSPSPSQSSMTCRISTCEPGQARRISWWREGVVDDISHEGLRVHAPRRGRQLGSTAENVEGLEGPAVRGEEGAGRAPVRDRRAARLPPAKATPEIVFCVDEFGPS